MDAEGGELVLPETAWAGNAKSKGFILVGQLLTSRPFQLDVLRITLLNLLKPIRGMQVRLLETNHFLLVFDHRFDRNRTMSGCSWMFDKNLIIFSRVGMSDNPLTVELNRCPFHIHVYGPPTRMMTREVAEFIGNRVLGHIIRDCSRRVESDSGNGGDHLQYGAWLRKFRGVGQFASQGWGSGGVVDGGVRAGWKLMRGGGANGRGIIVGDAGGGSGYKGSCSRSKKWYVAEG
ncbi:hypothetical protein Salat_0719700 [Sesamum alatum]|uniref:DUF4283 domain-containing protein n=1 Tax=Sesamum alatum TaxID=300844 RepID=A0AAE1YT04_9LAMI|nr:hypothetical protein Salat_0719700 [Sesamum alatum]